MFILIWINPEGELESKVLHSRSETIDFVYNMRCLYEK
jgi:hypothetical protein